MDVSWTGARHVLLPKRRLPVQPGMLRWQPVSATVATTTAAAAATIAATTTAAAAAATTAAAAVAAGLVSRTRRLSEHRSRRERLDLGAARGRRGELGDGLQRAHVQRRVLA